MPENSPNSRSSGDLINCGDTAQFVECETAGTTLTGEAVTAPVHTVNVLGQSANNISSAKPAREMAISRRRHFRIA